MNLSQNIKPLHLLIGIVVCVVVGIALARLVAPTLTKPDESDEIITIDAQGRNRGNNLVNTPPQR